MYEISPSTDIVRAPMLQSGPKEVTSRRKAVFAKVASAADVSTPSTSLRDAMLPSISAANALAPQLGLRSVMLSEPWSAVMVAVVVVSPEDESTSVGMENSRALLFWPQASPASPAAAIRPSKLCTRPPLVLIAQAENDSS